MTCLILSLILSPFRVLSPSRSAIPFRVLSPFRSAFPFRSAIPSFRFRVLSQPPTAGTAIAVKLRAESKLIRDGKDRVRSRSWNQKVIMLKKQFYQTMYLPLFWRGRHTVENTKSCSKIPEIMATALINKCKRIGILCFLFEKFIDYELALVYYPTPSFLLHGSINCLQLSLSMSQRERNSNYHFC